MKKKKILLWIDDLRNPYELPWLDWIKINCNINLDDYTIIWIRSYFEFSNFLDLNEIPDYICFDHDLGDTINNPEKTGYDCAKLLIDKCIDKNINIPEFNIQSDNGPGRININSILNNYKKFYLTNTK